MILSINDVFILNHANGTVQRLAEGQSAATTCSAAADEDAHHGYDLFLLEATECSNRLICSTYALTR